MAWIRIDDQMPDHPKVEPLSDAAFRWIFRGLSYANRFLTDGVLPKTFLQRVPDAVREELVTAGIWKVTRKQLRIHDYADYQPSKAEVERERQLNRDRQSRWRQSRVSNGVTKHNGVINGAPARPVPSRSIKRSPQPPAGAGGVKILRGDWKQADAVLRSWLGWCKHAPVCANHALCRQRLAVEQAEKRLAS